MNGVCFRADFLGATLGLARRSGNGVAVGTASLGNYTARFLAGNGQGRLFFGGDAGVFYELVDSGKALPVAFSIPGGFEYQNDLRIVLTTETPGARVHYTLDGSEPDEAHPYVESGATVLINRSAEGIGVSLLTFAPLRSSFGVTPGLLRSRIRFGVAPALGTTAA